MRCPYCGGSETQVKDSRPSEDGAAIRRRRVCPDCGGRFTTFERVQLREVVVVKSGDRREPFDRSKLEQSVTLACRKRGLAQERLDQRFGLHDFAFFFCLHRSNNPVAVHDFFHVRRRDEIALLTVYFKKAKAFLSTFNNAFDTRSLRVKLLF